MIKKSSSVFRRSTIFSNGVRASQFIPQSFLEMETVNRFAIGFESKEAGKLLSLAAFEEMIDFD